MLSCRHRSDLPVALHTVDSDAPSPIGAPFTPVGISIANRRLKTSC